MIVVDAAAGPPPGTVERFDAVAAPLPAAYARRSTHSFGVGDAIELARALDRLPSRLDGLRDRRRRLRRRPRPDPRGRARRRHAHPQPASTQRNADVVPRKRIVLAPDARAGRRGFAVWVRTATKVRPEIQALRALAVMLVVVYHLWPQTLHGGFVGVDVFFAISGFLITSLLLREIDRTQRLSLSGFYARRARRILPASLVTLGCVGSRRSSSSRWLLAAVLRRLTRAALYVQNWHLRPRGRLLRADRGRPGAALLVALGRGAVLPRLADAAALVLVARRPARRRRAIAS